MNIFGAIMHKIFHHPAAATASAGSVAPSEPPAASPSSAPTPQAPSPATAPQATQPVDVGAVLSQMASEKGGGGNYQSSIVDLLKLLDLDASLDARKQLAEELSVHVAADGSAEENMALHKAVMQKLAENGGKVPANLS